MDATMRSSERSEEFGSSELVREPYSRELFDRAHCEARKSSDFRRGKAKKIGTPEISSDF
jgi:hypothetical protein